MCGRVTLYSDPRKIADRFHVDSIALEEYKPRYNITPGSKTPIIISTEKGRRLETGKWGVKRQWPKPVSNLTTERLLYGTFTKQLAAQRCIVPVDGFYEWGLLDKRKTQAWFCLKSKDLFGFPALYDEGVIKMFSIFTTNPNSLVGKLHDRMPVILKPGSEDEWLDVSLKDISILHGLLNQYPAAEMSGYEVSKDVNYPANDSPELIKPIATL